MNHVQTMKHFITEDFLLSNTYSQRLYHEYARDLPIIDYHCHLPATELAEDKQFANLTDLWLRGDHYKWRAMRAHGIRESHITGEAADHDKFLAWANTVPYTLRNPLYHWTHLELRRYFGVDALLSGDTAAEVWEACNAQLATEDFRARKLVSRMGVEMVCTTDDPADSLEAHRCLAASDFGTQVLPTFRPDRVFQLDQPETTLPYLQQLAEVSGTEISNLATLLDALEQRLDTFHAVGGRLADHGFEQVPAVDASEADIAASFSRFLKGQALEGAELAAYQTYLIRELGQRYHARGWTQQFHLGPIRNTNTRLSRRVGADCGVDSIGDFNQAPGLAHLLDGLDATDQLAKTILYNVNPSQNEVFATMAGNFNDGSMHGKVQFGAAWWYLDQKQGIQQQLDIVSSMGLLSHFVGMVTDSRSLLSYIRHEYFRRILCDLLGQDVARGELPADMELLGEVVRRVCYTNARDYFQFPKA